jgi:[acyl-carrier-protein] S-malonyltransferase
VRWAQSISNMVGDGAETFYEVGPGRILAGLMKRDYRGVPVIPIGTLEDFNAINSLFS